VNFTNLWRYKFSVLLVASSCLRVITCSTSLPECKPCLTLVDTKSKVSAKTDTPLYDPRDFHSLATTLQYLTFTRCAFTCMTCKSFTSLHNLSETCVYADIFTKGLPSIMFIEFKFSLALHGAHDHSGGRVLGRLLVGCLVYLMSYWA
jgi:hypothetical protein